MKFLLKKLISALLVIMLVLALCSCRKNGSQNNTSDNASEITSEINSSEETETESGSDASDINSNSSVAESKEEESSKENSSLNSSSEKEKVCQHNYTYLEIGVSCDKDGYRQYECKKCGHTKKGEAVKAHHDFGKYLCERCGIIDKSTDNIFWGTSAWIERFGKPNGNEDIYCYPNDVSAVALGTPVGQEWLYMEYTDNANLISFSLSVNNKANCTLQFSDMKSNTRASCDDIKNSAVSSANKLEFSYFYCEDNSVDQDTFATDCAKNIDIYMNEFQKLLKKSGVTLKDLGFTAYK